MIEASISGRLVAAPARRISKAGRSFVSARLRVTQDNGEVIFANVVAFSERAQNELAELGEGEAVTVACSLNATTWTATDGTVRPTLDGVVSRVLTAWHHERRRRLMLGQGEPPARRTRDSRAGRARPRIEDGWQAAAPEDLPN